MSLHRCRFCHHLPHPDGRCGVKSVTGPAVSTSAASGYCPEDHTDLIVAAAKERRDLAWGKVIDNPMDEL